MTLVIHMREGKAQQKHSWERESPLFIALGWGSPGGDGHVTSVPAEGSPWTHTGNWQGCWNRRLLGGLLGPLRSRPQMCLWLCCGWLGPAIRASFWVKGDPPSPAPLPLPSRFGLDGPPTGLREGGAHLYRGPLCMVWQFNQPQSWVTEHSTVLAMLRQAPRAPTMAAGSAWASQHPQVLSQYPPCLTLLGQHSVPRPQSGSSAAPQSQAS